MGRKERASSDRITVARQLALKVLAASRTVVALSTDPAFLYFHEEHALGVPAGKKVRANMLQVHTERSVRNLHWHRLYVV